MKVADLVETVTKKPLNPNLKSFLVEVIVADPNDEVIDVSLFWKSRQKFEFFFFCRFQACLSRFEMPVN